MINATESIKTKEVGLVSRDCSQSFDIDDQLVSSFSYNVFILPCGRGAPGRLINVKNYFDVLNCSPKDIGLISYCNFDVADLVIRQMNRNCPLDVEDLFKEIGADIREVIHNALQGLVGSSPLVVDIENMCVWDMDKSYSDLVGSYERNITRVEDLYAREQFG